jgi:hypothetical protein
MAIFLWIPGGNPVETQAQAWLLIRLAVAGRKMGKLWQFSCGFPVGILWKHKRKHGC